MIRSKKKFSPPVKIETMAGAVPESSDGESSNKATESVPKANCGKKG